jgi:hypothetical protein
VRSGGVDEKELAEISPLEIPDISHILFRSSKKSYPKFLGPGIGWALGRKIKAEILQSSMKYGAIFASLIGWRLGWSTIHDLMFLRKVKLFYF